MRLTNKAEYRGYHKRYTVS